MRDQAKSKRVYTNCIDNKNNKLYKNYGFTLAELLVVVAIISVLVAIAIPIFSSQIEKSREAVDLANVRSAYAEVMAEAIKTESNKRMTGSRQILLQLLELLMPKAMGISNTGRVFLKRAEFV